MLKLDHFFRRSIVAAISNSNGTVGIVYRFYGYFFFLLMIDMNKIDSDRFAMRIIFKSVYTVSFICHVEIFLESFEDEIVMA